MMKGKNNRYVCMGLVLGSLFAGSLQAQTSYTTFPVPEAAPATSGSLSVDGINASGVITGYLYDTSGNEKGWMRDAEGNITLLVDPLDTTTPTANRALGINDDGMIVGFFFDTAAGLYYGYFYSAGNYETYAVAGQPTGTDTGIGGIDNKKANFCGFVLPPPYTVYQAFVSIHGAVTVFGVEGSSDTQCLAINDSGEAAGFYTDSANVLHGWVRSPSGTITTINVPGASTATGTVPCGGSAGGTEVEGINDSGYVSGHYYDTSNNEHGFVRAPNGKFTRLNVPGAAQTAGGGINSAGVVVGHWSDSSCNNSGYTATPAGGDWR
jgi:hypothetical protein